MTLIFYGNDHSGGGGGGGIPKDAIVFNYYDENIPGYTYLCTYAEVENIHSTSENSWEGEFDGNTIYFAIETNPETGENEFNIYYDGNAVKMTFSEDYFYTKYPIE